MKDTFVKYVKLDLGLHFDKRIEVDYPGQLSLYDDPVVKVEEDYRGKMRVETKNNVYVQDGYAETLGNS